jgi:hypothetical protein
MERKKEERRKWNPEFGGIKRWWEVELRCGDSMDMEMDGGGRGENTTPSRERRQQRQFEQVVNKSFAADEVSVIESHQLDSMVKATISSLRSFSPVDTAANRSLKRRLAPRLPPAWGA